LRPQPLAATWQTYQEAVAHLFAMADLVPDHQIDTLVQAGTANR
jgi:hypothetical protein